MKKLVPAEVKGVVEIVEYRVDVSRADKLKEVKGVLAEV